MRTRVAITDDWLGVARSSADWRPLEEIADVVVFGEPFRSEDDAANDLADFDVIIPMRERMAFSASLLRRLPRLKLLALTGYGTGHIDVTQARAQGIVLCGSGAYSPAATAELTLGLILAAQRAIPLADANLRAGRFQNYLPVGRRLDGATLGIVGLGHIGSQVAKYGQALGMKVIAWSGNLTAERAGELGVEAVSKDRLFAESDVISLHLFFSPRTAGIVGADELVRMKQDALLVNTARAQLVDQGAMIAAAHAGRIRVALDVFEQEPLAVDDPLRGLPNAIVTPHLGFSVEQTFECFYRESIENILAFLAGSPRRVITPKEA